MSDISKFIGEQSAAGKVPTTIKPLRTSVAIDLSAASLTFTNSGAMTANTYKDVLTLTGEGAINLAAVKANDSTSRTISAKLTLDGVQVVELSLVTATSGYGFVPVGYVESAGSGMALDQIAFTSSCVLAIKSSLTETDKMSFASAYRVR